MDYKSEIELYRGRLISLGFKKSVDQFRNICNGDKEFGEWLEYHLLKNFHEKYKYIFSMSLEEMVEYG